MSTKAETTGQMVERLGYTWAEWRGFTKVQRAEILSADLGVPFTDENRAAIAVLDLPVEDRLPAFHAALRAKGLL